MAMTYARYQVPKRANKARAVNLKRINSMVKATGLPLMDLMPATVYTLEAPGRVFHGMKIMGGALMAWHNKYSA